MSINRLVKYLCGAGIGFFLVLSLFLLFDSSLLEESAQKEFSSSIQWHTVQSWQWWCLAFVHASFQMVMVWGLFNLWQLFAAFEQNRYFEKENVLYIRRFALALLISGLLRPVQYSLSSILLSLNHPAGEKMVSIQLGNRELELFFIGLVFWVIASVLLNAIAVADENKKFI